MTQCKTLCKIKLSVILITIYIKTSILLKMLKQVSDGRMMSGVNWYDLG